MHRAKLEEDYHVIYLVFGDYKMKNPDKAKAMLLENLRIISEHKRRSLTAEQLR